MQVEMQTSVLLHDFQEIVEFRERKAEGFERRKWATGQKEMREDRRGENISQRILSVEDSGKQTMRENE